MRGLQPPERTVLSKTVFQWALLGLLMSATASAHHPSGPEPVTNDVVIAKVYTDSEDRLKQLRENHDLWYYLWREGYAVIRTDRNRLPADAQIDQALTAGLYAPPVLSKGGGTLGARPCYRTVEQTYADLQALSVSHPDLATWVDIGDRWQKSQGLAGHDTHALVLTNSSIPGPKPIYMVMSAIHARELTTAEVNTRFAEMLVANYGVDADTTWMLDYFEVHILPQQNPDGRKMAEAQCASSCNPGWRKNTNQNYCGAASSSRGADLNRNSSGTFWGGSSASGSACNDSYRGPSAASEPETQSVENYAASVFPDFRVESPGDLTTPADPNADGVFVSIHSTGDIAFYPWEGSNALPPNLAGLRGLAQKMGFASGFAACQNCFLGPASGTTVDNIYEKLGIAAYTFEIGSSFGQSCASFESTVLPETLAGLQAGIKHTRRPYQTALGPDVRDVTLISNGGSITLNAVADDTRRAVNGGGEPVDAAQPIAEVRYTVGEPPWIATQAFALNADDGQFDESIEAVSAPLTQISGQSIVFVYAIDSNGNQGPPSAVFVNADDIFADGMESPVR